LVVLFATVMELAVHKSAHHRASVPGGVPATLTVLAGAFAEAPERPR